MPQIKEMGAKQRPKAHALGHALKGMPGPPQGRQARTPLVAARKCSTLDVKDLAFRNMYISYSNAMMQRKCIKYMCSVHDGVWEFRGCNARPNNCSIVGRRHAL